MSASKYDKHLKKTILAHKKAPTDTLAQRLQLLLDLLLNQCQHFFLVDLKLSPASYQHWLNDTDPLLIHEEKLNVRNRRESLTLIKLLLQNYRQQLNAQTITERAINHCLVELQTLKAEIIVRDLRGDSQLVMRLRIVDDAFKTLTTQAASAGSVTTTLTPVTQKISTVKLSSTYDCRINEWAGDATACNQKVILLLHGRNLSGRTYQSIASALAKLGYVVVAPDLKGLGENRNHALSLEKTENHIKLIYAYIKRQFPDMEIIPIGHSLGASILLSHHQKLDANNVRKLILLNPALNEFSESSKSNVSAMFRLLLSGFSNKRFFYINSLPETKKIRQYDNNNTLGFRHKCKNLFVNLSNTNKILSKAYHSLTYKIEHIKSLKVLVVQSKFDKIVNNIRTQSDNVRYKMIYGDHLQVIRDGEYFANLIDQFISEQVA